MHLWDIRNKNVDPEAHLRGFLKVFEDTEVFQAEFGRLDERMKRMVGVFVAGGGSVIYIYITCNFLLFSTTPVSKHEF